MLTIAGLLQQPSTARIASESVFLNSNARAQKLTEPFKVTERYQGNSGDRYFDVRSTRRASWIQAVNAKFFLRYIDESDDVLDFGCGTGEIISRIPCRSRFGVEVNEPSRREAESRGVHVLHDLTEMESSSVDVVISHHALEHVSEPAPTLRELVRVLRPGGRAIIVVPAENPRRAATRTWHDEPEKHLFSWSPLTLGNLMEDCGFTVKHAFIREFGYSHFLNPVRRVPLVYPLARRILALFLDRFHSVCIAGRPNESGR